MDTQLAANIINLIVGVSTFLAVVVALGGIWLNRKQAREDWLHSQQQVTEERQNQSRPVIVPIGKFTSSTVMADTNLYAANGLVNWNYQNKINLELQNMGGGVALNVQCVLYGSEPPTQLQFVSWDNGPIGKNPVPGIFEHPQRLQLSANDSIDGIHHLFDMSLDSASNPTKDRIACLTITYHDLFEIKHISVFNYTLEHRWVYVTINKIPGKSPLDLKELNDQKKQSPKLSAPPIITS